MRKIYIRDIFAGRNHEKSKMENFPVKKDKIFEMEEEYSDNISEFNKLSDLYLIVHYSSRKGERSH
jgi:hypothetical protein